MKIKDVTKLKMLIEKLACAKCHLAESKALQRKPLQSTFDRIKWFEVKIEEELAALGLEVVN